MDNFAEWLMLEEDDADFQRWFQGSKVVGKDGKPLVVYRGDQPSRSSLGGNIEGNRIQGNIFFSGRPSVAAFYIRDRLQSKYSSWHMMKPDRFSSADGFYRAYLALKKPLIIDAKGESWLDIPVPKNLRKITGSDTLQIDELAQLVRKMGRFDGLIVTDMMDQAGDDDQYVAFDPRQVWLIDAPPSQRSTPHD